MRDNFRETKQKRSQKICATQKKFLIQYLLDHPAIVSRKLTNTFTIDDLNYAWSELATKLNELGPPKTVKGLKKVTIVW